jgi:hypothetical protein
MLVESSPHCGGVAERLKAAVLKTAEGQPSVSSNLTSSAIFCFKSLIIQGFFLPKTYNRYWQPRLQALSPDYPVNSRARPESVCSKHVLLLFLAHPDNPAVVSYNKEIQQHATFQYS